MGFLLRVLVEEIRVQKKIPLYEPPIASTAFEPEAFFCKNCIFFSYLRDEVQYKSGIKFHNVKEYEYHSESICELWHIEDVYDNLVEILPSKKVAKIHKSTLDYQIKRSESWHLKHYMIYLEGGCFEIIAESWEILIEEEGVWSFPS